MGINVVAVRGTGKHQLSLTAPGFAPVQMDLWDADPYAHTAKVPDALARAERTRLRAVLDAVTATLFGLDPRDLQHIVHRCGSPRAGRSALPPSTPRASGASTRTDPPSSAKPSLPSSPTTTSKRESAKHQATAPPGFSHSSTRTTAKAGFFPRPSASPTTTSATTAPPPSGVRRPEPDWARAHRELQRHKGVTLQLLWLEYRTAHPDGYQYSWFCKRYREWRAKGDVAMRQVYRAGEKAFVDYAGPTFEVVDRKTGEVRDALVFVGVLGASNYTFVDVTWSRALPDWTMSHVPDVRVLRRGARARDPGQREGGGPQGQPLRAGAEPHVPGTGQPGGSPPSPARDGTTSWKSSTTATPGAAPCSPARCPSSTGTRSSAIPPSATPSSTDSPTTRTASPSRAPR